MNIARVHGGYVRVIPDSFRGGRYVEYAGCGLCWRQVFCLFGKAYILMPEPDGPATFYSCY